MSSQSNQFKLIRITLSALERTGHISEAASNRWSNGRKKNQMESSLNRFISFLNCFVVKVYDELINYHSLLTTAANVTVIKQVSVLISKKY